MTEQELDRRIRSICRETIYEILDTDVYDNLFPLLDAFEAGIIGFKQGAARKRVLPKSQVQEPAGYDLQKISWETRQGAKGPYEKSDDAGNPHHKALLKDLAQHRGAMQVDSFFVWVFEDGTTIGRKRVAP